LKSSFQPIPSERFGIHCSHGGKTRRSWARDTLRLEAALPLYGHEFGLDPDGSEIPILACPVAKYAVSFDANKGDYTGKAALLRQAEALKRYAAGDFTQTADLPGLIRPFRVIDAGIVRAGAIVYDNRTPVGYVTSGTMAPFWVPETQGDSIRLTEQRAQRAPRAGDGQAERAADTLLEAEVRGRRLKLKLVRRNLENRKSDTAFAVME
jgi:aminomethyltransferase